MGVEIEKALNVGMVDSEDGVEFEFLEISEAVGKPFDGIVRAAVELDSVFAADDAQAVAGEAIEGLHAAFVADG